MDETRREPFLLTPGPLTTTAATKAAMLRDWGSRDGEFIAMNARVRRRLLELVSGDGSHVCVPLQGSGTFIVEAMIGTLVPPAGKLLVLVNGAYGRRMVRICEYYRRACVAQETAEDQPVDPAALDARLGADPAITHVVVVHCETTSGVLNPVEEIAAVVARRGRRLLDRRDERVRRAAAGRAAGAASTRWWPRRTSAWRACPASASRSCGARRSRRRAGKPRR